MFSSRTMANKVLFLPRKEASWVLLSGVRRKSEISAGVQGFENALRGAIPNFSCLVVETVLQPFKRDAGPVSSRQQPGNPVQNR